MVHVGSAVHIATSPCSWSNASWSSTLAPGVHVHSCRVNINNRVLGLLTFTVRACSRIMQTDRRMNWNTTTLRLSHRTCTTYPHVVPSVWPPYFVIRCSVSPHTYLLTNRIFTTKPTGKKPKHHAISPGLRSKREIVFLPGASCMMFTANINTGSHFREPMSANTQPRIICHDKWSTRQRRRSLLRVRPLIANYSYCMGYAQVPYTHRSRQRSIWTTGLRSKRTRPF